MVPAPAERHPPPDIGLPGALPGLLVVDLAVPNRDGAAGRHAAGEPSRDLLPLRLREDAASPAEVEGHPAAVHALSPLHVVLAPQPLQGARADRPVALQLGPAVGLHDHRQLRAPPALPGQLAGADLAPAELDQGVGLALLLAAPVALVGDADQRLQAEPELVAFGTRQRAFDPQHPVAELEDPQAPLLVLASRRARPALGIVAMLDLITQP